MLHVTVLKNSEDLERNHLLWRALAARTRHPSFHQSPEYYRAVRAASPAGTEYHALVVHDRTTPLGILPLLSIPVPSLLGAAVALKYASLDESADSGPIGDQPAATLTAALRYLTRRHAAWDLIDLNGVNVAHTDRLRTATAFYMVGMRVVESVTGRQAFVPVDSLRDMFVGSTANGLARWSSELECRLGVEGRVRYVRRRPVGASHGGGAVDWNLYDRCRAVEATWLDRERSVREFGRERLRRELYGVAWRLGAVDVNVLFVDDRPVAFCHSHHAAGRLHVVRAGVAADSPVSSELLIARMLGDGWNRGDTAYYLGELTRRLPDFIASESVSSHRYVHFRTMGGRARNAMASILGGMKRTGA